MSERNGDRARFQKNRKRKLARRRRIRALRAGVQERTGGRSGGTITPESARETPQRGPETAAIEAAANPRSA